MSANPLDQNVENVRRKLAQRAEIGLKKYGVTTERTDLTTLDWLNHLQEETMDSCVYLERLIQDETARIAAQEEPVGDKPALLWNPGERAWACAKCDDGSTDYVPVIINAVDEKGILVHAAWDADKQVQFNPDGGWRHTPRCKNTAWLEVRHDD